MIPFLAVGSFSGGRKGLLFLVVDDDELSRELFLVLLAEEGDQVKAEASGSDALLRLQAFDSQPDVILTDIQMPGLTGEDLAKALRKASPAGTLLFAMSGSMPLASLRDEFDGFLLKPFTLSDVKSMISLLTSSRGRSATQSSANHLLPGADQQLSTSDSSAAGHPEPENTRDLDEDIYQKLSELMSGEPLEQMYAMCIEDARTRIGVMRDLAAAGDDDGYRQEAHAVKGGSGMIGATQLYRYAAEAERNGLADSHQSTGTFDVTVTLDALSFACDRLERILVERNRN